jgi:hypothetical protein
MAARQSRQTIWDGRGDRLSNARYSFMPGRAADDLSLTGLHLRLLAHIGRWNSDKGFCRLSQKELAERWGVRRQSVNKSIGELVESRYIERLPQQRTGESYCVSRVIINQDGVSPAADTPPKGNGGVTPTGDRGVTERDTGVSPPRTPNSDQVDLIDHSPCPLTSEQARASASSRRAPALPFQPTSVGDALRGTALGDQLAKLGAEIAARGGSA